jgi:ubiquinone/menaquinone biosynthesis C-methylase UbiE
MRLVKQAHGRIGAQFDERALRYRAKYEAPTHLFHLEKLRRLELLVDYARTLRPHHILDAGSGPGIALSALQTCLPDANLAGIDLSFSMLQQARTDALDGIPLIQSRVERLPFAGDSFDLVYALGVLDYLRDPSEFFRSAHRVLKPGGHFLFTYPNADSVNRGFRTRLRSLFAAPRNAVSAAAIHSASVDRWLEYHGFELLHRHFITYGNGLVFFPWQTAMNRNLERWLRARPIRRYLAWSCVCLTRKPHP